MARPVSSKQSRMVGEERWDCGCIFGDDEHGPDCAFAAPLTRRKGYDWPTGFVFEELADGTYLARATGLEPRIFDTKAECEDFADSLGRFAVYLERPARGGFRVERMTGCATCDGRGYVKAWVKESPKPRWRLINCQDCIPLAHADEVERLIASREHWREMAYRFWPGDFARPVGRADSGV